MLLIGHVVVQEALAVLVPPELEAPCSVQSVLHMLAAGSIVHLSFENRGCVCRLGSMTWLWPWEQSCYRHGSLAFSGGTSFFLWLWHSVA